MITKQYWFTLSLAILSLCSCGHEKEELQPQPIPDEIYGDMTVTFDWSLCDGEKPASMSLYLFNEENQSIPVSFPNATGGKVQLLKGKYQALAYNSDTETMKGSGSSWEDFTISILPPPLKPACLPAPVEVYQKPLALIIRRLCMSPRYSIRPPMATTNSRRLLMI